MSIHSNQAKSGGPTSSRSEIRGSNRTYVSSVQREGKSGKAAPKPKAKKPSASAPSSDANAFRATAAQKTAAGANVGGPGDGHYTPRQ